MCHGFRTCLERLLSLSQEMNEAPSSSNGAVWSVPHHHILNLTLTMLLDKIGKALAFGDSYWQSGAIQLPCEEENNVEIHRCLCQQWSPWPLPRGKTWASTPSWVLWTQRWLFFIDQRYIHASKYTGSSRGLWSLNLSDNGYQLWLKFLRSFDQAAMHSADTGVCYCYLK